MGIPPRVMLTSSVLPCCSSTSILSKEAPPRSSQSPSITSDTSTVSRPRICQTLTLVISCTSGVRMCSKPSLDFKQMLPARA